MSDPLSADRLPDLVNNQIESFIRVIEELKRALPPSGPTRFADALDQVVTGVHRYFPKELNLIADPQEQVARCKKYLSFLKEMHEKYLRRLTPVDEGLVPSEVRFSLQEQVHLLLGAYGSKRSDPKDQEGDPTYDLRLSPFSDWNYETSGYLDLVGYLLRKLTIPDLAREAPAHPFPLWFIFIEYPSAWARDALMVPIFVHEVSHFIDWARGLQARLGPMSFDAQSFDECVRHYTGSPFNMSEYAARLLVHRQCSEILSAWQTEYICDVVALRLLGPAYFFAFAELSVLLDILGSSSPTHPPSGFRLMHQYEELRDMGYLGDRSSLRQLLEKARAALDAHMAEPSAAEQKVVYRTLRKAITYDGDRGDLGSARDLKGIRKKIVEPIVPHSYSCPTYEQEVPALADKYFSQGKVVGDTWQGDAQHEVTFRGILNAGWHTYLLRAGEFFQAVGATDDKRRREAQKTLSELMLKSIEASDIFRRWRRARA